MNLSQLLHPQKRQDYTSHLEAEGYSPASISRKDAAINQFQSWVEATNQIPANPPEFITSSPTKSNFLSNISPKQWAIAIASLTGLVAVVIFLLFLNIPGRLNLGSSAREGDNLTTENGPKSPLTASSGNTNPWIIHFQGQVTSSRAPTGDPESTSSASRTPTGQVPTGNLTGALKPLNQPGKFAFKLYSESTGGAPLWTSKTWEATPNKDGAIQVPLGDTTRSDTPIPSDSFFRYEHLFLGVSVNNGPELTNRFRVSTAANAANSYLLDNFPGKTAATKDSIPIINNDGVLTLASDSPKISAENADFAIVGQTITLQTPFASDGDITLAPDGEGTLNLRLSNEDTSSVSISNANLEDGALIQGQVGNDETNYQFLEFTGGASSSAKFSVSAIGNVYFTGGLRDDTLATFIPLSDIENTSLPGNAASIIGALNLAYNTALDAGGTPATTPTPTPTPAGSPSANAFSDGGTYLYPTSRESVRIYDSVGTNYIDISDDGSNAVLDVNSGELQFKDKVSIQGSLNVGDIGALATIGGSGDLTINMTGGDVILSNGTTLNIGGSGSDVAYNVIGDTTSGASSSMGSDDDLYIEGNLEVDGTITGSINPGFTIGSVTFQGSSGLAEDNSNFFWDDTNNFLGLGDATPDDRLDIESSSLGYNFLFGSNGLTFSGAGTSSFVMKSGGAISLSGGTGQSTASGLTVNSSGDLVVGNNDLVADVSTGRIGIGTASPSQKLHVVVNDTNTDSVIRALRLDHTTTGTAANGIGVGIDFIAEDNGGTAEGAARITGILTDVTAANELGALIFSTKDATNNMTEQVRIDHAGNMGIGDTSPDDKLDIENSTLGYNFLFGSNGITFSTSGTSGINVDTYGQLSLTTNQGAANALELISNSGGIDISTGSSTGDIDILSGDAINLKATSGAISLSAGSSNYGSGLTIDAQGQVGVGIANPTSDFYVYGGNNANHATTVLQSDYSTADYLSQWLQLDIVNTNTTTNNTAGISFSDQAGGGYSSTLIATIFTDHTNNYGNLAFWTNDASGGAENLTIEGNSGGQIGMGDTTPDDKLDIENSTLGYNFLFGSNGVTFSTSGTSGINADTFGQLSLTTNQGAASALELISNSGGIDISTGSGTGDIDILSGDAVNIKGINGAISLSAGTQTAGSGLQIDTSGIVRTNQIKAHDSAGLALYEDSGSGIFVEDGGQVGIGTTNPGYKLDVVGSSPTIAINPSSGYAQLSLQAASGNLNYIEYITGDLSFFNAAERMRLTTGGNLGIGDTSPDDKLDIEDSGLGYNFLFGSNGVTLSTSGTSGINTDTYGQLSLTTNQGSASALELISTAGGIDISTGSGTGDIDILSGDGLNLKAIGSDLTLSGGTTTYASGLVVDSVNGYVGIGTASPETGFHIANQSQLMSNGQIIYFENSSGTNRSIITYTTANNLILGSAVSADNGDIYLSSGGIFAVKPTGRVGIGDATPDDDFDVEDSALGYNFLFGSDGITFSTATSDNIVMKTGGSISLSGGTSGTNSSGITINTSGKVGIGQASPTYMLELGEDSAAKPTSNTWTIVSDERLKENIQTFGDGLDVIKQINTVSYELNGQAGTPKGAKGIGVLAQQVKDIIPYTIKTFKAKLSPTDTEATELYSFDSSALTFVLINAVKDLDKKVSSLIPPTTPTPPNSLTVEEIAALKLQLAGTTTYIPHLETQTIKTESIEASSSSFGSIVTQSLVASRLSAEDATISGQLDANQLEARRLSAEEISTSTISARLAKLEQLEAGEIKSQTIDSLASRLSSLEASNSSQLDASPYPLEATSSATPNLLAIDQDLSVGNLESLFVNSDAGFFKEYLGVMGEANINQLNVENTAIIGKSLALGTNSISLLGCPPTANGLPTTAVDGSQNAESTCDNTLYIQPTGKGKLSLLANLMTLEDNGTVTINGNLAISGQLDANQLNAKRLTVAEATVSGTLSFRPSGFADIMASINASGSAKFQDVTAKVGAFDQLIIAQGESTPSAGFLSSTLTTNATTGTATLNKLQTELKIENPKIGNSSLIYITPTSATQNQVLYVKSKRACPNTDKTDCQPYFTVAIDKPLPIDISFNWWIIN